MCGPCCAARCMARSGPGTPWGCSDAPCRRSATPCSTSVAGALGAVDEVAGGRLETAIFVAPKCHYWHMCSNYSLPGVALSAVVLSKPTPSGTTLSGVAPQCGGGPLCGGASSPGGVSVPDAGEWLVSDGGVAVAGGVVAALAFAIDGLSAADVAGLPVGSLADDLVDLHKQLARLQGQVARRVAALDSASGGQIDGYNSTASWLRVACSLTAAQASGLVRMARMLRGRPASAEALDTGRIGYAHTQVITTAFADLPLDTHDAAEPILLEAAGKLDPGRLRMVATRLRETINRDHAERSEQRDHARRRLYVSSTLDGMVAVDGLLDAEAGGILLTALTPLAKPLGPDDTRTPAQLRADALVEIAGHVLKTGNLPTVAGHRPNVNVTITLDSLTKRPGSPGGGLDWAGPVTAEIARRVACDSAVTRIVLGPESEVLDVGRTQRLVTPAQRKALAVRDRGCTWAGCERPAWWTDAHHVVSWADGGNTDLNNLLLLCRTHHRWTHEGKQPTGRRGNQRPTTPHSTRIGPAP